MKTFIIYMQYFLTLLAWGFLNPWGVMQGFSQVIGQWLAAGRALRKSQDLPKPSLVFGLPFQGTWLVGNGGVTRQTSHSWSALSQRFAYDFVITDAVGKTYAGDPSQPVSYYAFGQPVLAAADGVVVAVREDILDCPRAGTGWIDWRTRDIRGNHIVIQHAPHLFTLYAHLKHGSLRVKPGQRVSRGDVIAACGHSGHSTEPHLHFQLQDRANFYTAVGLPIRFSSFERKTGEQPFETVREGYAEKGQQIRPMASLADGRVDPEMDYAPSLGDWVSSTLNLTLTFMGYGYVLALVVRLILGAVRALGFI